MRRPSTAGSVRHKAWQTASPAMAPGWSAASALPLRPTTGPAVTQRVLAIPQPRPIQQQSGAIRQRTPATARPVTRRRRVFEVLTDTSFHSRWELLKRPFDPLCDAKPLRLRVVFLVHQETESQSTRLTAKLRQRDCRSEPGCLPGPCAGQTCSW